MIFKSNMRLQYLLIVLFVTGLNHTLELSELTRQQLEEEIVSLTKDKQEVIAQLNMVSG